MNDQKRTSFFTKLLLKMLYNRSYSDGFAGDIEEEYNERAADKGKSSANFWLVKHIIKSLPGSIANNTIWSFVMYKNYLKTAIRNILKNKVSSVINIMGLALGIASCIIVILFVKDELSVVTFHENYKYIYRFRYDLTLDTGKISKYATVRGQALEYLMEDLPEVVAGAKIDGHKTAELKYEDKKFSEINSHVTSDFLSIFSFPLLKGDKNTVLNAPFKAVITEKLSKKIFTGGENPIGKTIMVSKDNYEITGVLKDIPSNSIFEFDLLTSFSSLRTINGAERFDRSSRYEAYVLLENNANIENTRNKLPDFALNRYGKKGASSKSYHLQELSEIYFSPKMALEHVKKSEIKFSYIYSLIGILILIIGCINFINLTTARATKRAREVGIRKVVGARKSQLVKQFIGESLLMAMGGFLIALALVKIALPYFNDLTEKELLLSITGEPTLFFGLFGLSVIIGLISGIYPAFVLSSFHPVDVIKSSNIKSDSGKLFQKALIIFQFAISIVFLIGITVVQHQMKFIQNKDLGFKTDNILTFGVYQYKSISQKFDLVKDELVSNPNIIDVLGYYNNPGIWGGSEIKFNPEGFGESGINMNFIHAAPNYFNFFEMKITQGREFSKNKATDPTKAVLLNETAVKVLGWDNPIGKNIKCEMFDLDAVVVGVAKDYNAGNLYGEISPSVIVYDFRENSTIAVKIKSGTHREVRDYLTTTLLKFDPEFVLSSTYLDEDIAKAYSKEVKTGSVYKFASFMSLFLACLGLFGLASFTVQNRIKEIGIRKVLGGSVMSLVNLISLDFVKLVVAANIIAWPVAYYIMSQYLESFAYRIELGPWLFISAGLIALAISLITIAFQSIKAAYKNPVDVLRCE